MNGLNLDDKFDELQQDLQHVQAQVPGNNVSKITSTPNVVQKQQQQRACHTSTSESIATSKFAGLPPLPYITSRVHSAVRAPISTTSVIYMTVSDIG